MEEICLSGSLQSPTEIKASGGLQGCADEVCQQNWLASRSKYADGVLKFIDNQEEL